MIILDSHRKIKKYILIGAIVIILAVLAIIITLFFFKDKTLQAPVINLSSMKEKLQQEKIQKEFDALEKQRAQSGAVPPTPEQIQAEFDKLEQMKKQ